MATRRFPIGLVVPVLLIALVAVLGTLQYRWLGQVSEAEREQLSRSFSQRARDFGQEFDNILSGLFQAVSMRSDPAVPASGEELAAALDVWRREARFPRLVKRIYLTASVTGADPVLRPWDASTHAFGDPLATWPSHFASIRRMLGAFDLPRVLPLPPGSTVMTLSMTSTAPDVPALLVPVPNPLTQQFAFREGASADARSSERADAAPSSPRAHLVVELDRAYVIETVLPALAADYFPDTAEHAYSVAVMAADGSRVFSRGPVPSALATWQVHTTVPFFSIRPSARTMSGDGKTQTVVAGRVGAQPGERSGPAGAERIAVIIEHQSEAGRNSVPSGSFGGGEMRVVRRGWMLLVQHAAGSLDLAVQHARRRNLWLSFGILSVLVAGVVLVMVNARRSEQLASRQLDFVATVSHELRTPLAVIRSAAQNLAAGVVADPAQARRYGNLIESEGSRLTDMVEQVIDYAGLEGKRSVRSPQRVDVPALVEEVAASCKPTCDEAGCALDVDLGDDVLAPAVMGDEAALGRVFHNLIMNAAKHGADGKWIGVSVSSCSVRGGREVCVTVRDRGQGIDAADLPHVFEPFRRGRRASEQQIRGNGLGLSLVKRVVDAHGGRVAVTSAPGEGASFAVYLPAGSGAGEGGDAGGPAAARDGADDGSTP